MYLGSVFFLQLLLPFSFYVAKVKAEADSDSGDCDCDCVCSSLVLCELCSLAVVNVIPHS